jgi:hypothetical protein
LPGDAGREHLQLTALIGLGAHLLWTRSVEQRDVLVVASDDVVEDLLEECAFRPERRVDGVDRDAGRACDVSDRGCRIATCEKQLASRRDDPATGLTSLLIAQRRPVGTRAVDGPLFSL